MTIPVLIILGILWAAVLVPPLLRARSDRKTGAIGDYAHTLGVLKTSNRKISGTRTAAALVDGSMHNPVVSKRSALKKRRRDVFNGLAGTVVVLGVVSLVTRQSITITLFLLAGVALGVYSYLLFQINEMEKQKRIKSRKTGTRAKDGI